MIASRRVRGTRTTDRIHELVRAHIAESSLFNGQISGIGPRYCPSLEDKVMRFPHRERHQIVLEPEGPSVLGVGNALNNVMTAGLNGGRLEGREYTAAPKRIHAVEVFPACGRPAPRLGPGRPHATFNAIKLLVPHDAKLDLYQQLLDGDLRLAHRLGADAPGVWRV
jgi:hypothetical protein